MRSNLVRACARASSARQGRARVSCPKMRQKHSAAQRYRPRSQSAISSSERSAGGMSHRV
eukprot:6802266-Pyramimonas_sp.AAC.1